MTEQNTFLKGAIHRLKLLTCSLWIYVGGFLVFVCLFVFPRIKGVIVRTPCLTLSKAPVQASYAG